MDSLTSYAKLSVAILVWCLGFFVPKMGRVRVEEIHRMISCKILLRETHQKALNDSQGSGKSGCFIQAIAALQDIMFQLLWQL